MRYVIYREADRGYGSPKIFYYFPDGEENLTPGEIAVDFEKQSVKLIKPAEGDMPFIMGQEQATLIRDVMRKSAGEKLVQELTAGIEGREFYPYGFFAVVSLKEHLMAGGLPVQNVVVIEG